MAEWASFGSVNPKVRSPATTRYECDLANWPERGPDQFDLATSTVVELGPPKLLVRTYTKKSQARADPRGSVCCARRTAKERTDSRIFSLQ